MQSIYRRSANPSNGKPTESTTSLPVLLITHLEHKASFGRSGSRNPGLAAIDPAFEHCALRSGGSTLVRLFEELLIPFKALQVARLPSYATVGLRQIGDLATNDRSEWTAGRF